MAIYYCGPGGNDANSGLTWALRKLTLNGCEDVPITAGSTVYVAPGVYREMLTCDVSGAAGSPITYIGDVSGEHTDGVGGIVRITGSDNDQAAARNYCITAAGRDYRTFRGFELDFVVLHAINNTFPDNWIVEDCTIQAYAQHGISFGDPPKNNTIRRCILMGGGTNYSAISFGAVVVTDAMNNLVENCIIIGKTGTFGITFTRTGDCTVRNCMIWGGTYGIRSSVALNAGHGITVNDCLIIGNGTGFSGSSVNDIIEDYNTLYNNAADRAGPTNVGANSVTYPPIFDFGIFHAGASQVSGFHFPPPLFGTLSQWSQVRAIADTGAATEDILGLPRPVTDGKRSWGAVQYVPMIRDTTNPRTGTACKELEDAGREQIYVPTTSVSTVFSVWVYREANYAGVNPQMIIKQPGQADVTVTDAGVAGVYNQLTTTLTPAALPGYVVIELVSNNTAAGAGIACYFDDLTVI